jgi:hypothetical protein
MLAAGTKGLDIRFQAGVIDAPELPFGHKRAEAVVRQFRDLGLVVI